MKKIVIKSVYLFTLFVVALILISAVVNQSNTDMTMEMGPASFPVVNINVAGYEINSLQGYTNPLNSSFQRDALTPLAEGRRVNLSIDKYNQDITGISFEVRSIDGARLVESTTINKYEEDENKIQVEFAIKDLIEVDIEYMLVFLVETGDGNIIRYYTRIIYSENYHTSEKIKFVFNFHNKTFIKEGEDELAKYLESNAQGDNTTLSKVTIYSRLSQVMWGGLDVTKKTDPTLTIKEMGIQTASIEMNYIISIDQGKKEKLHYVKEFYRIRYTADRIYLLDYERTMEQIFDESKEVFSNNKISLGINDKQDLTIRESDGGNVFAFTDGSRLYSYNASDNKVARLFSFYQGDYADARIMRQKHGIRILNVDEAGNVQFIVYGYMNRGRREGNLGIIVYQYSGPLNTVEEMAFIPSNTSYEILKADVKKLAYINKAGVFFFLYQGAIHAVDLGTMRSEQLVSDLMEGSYQISDSNRMAAWQTSENRFASEALVLMNLNTKKRMEIKAGSDEYIAPLGFLGEDLIYGLVKKEDVTKDSMGSIYFPMYKIIIQSEENEILKSYQEDNIYTIASTIEENQINLVRQKRDVETGNYTPINDYQIVNTMPESASSNVVEEVVTESYQKVIQIAAKTTIDVKSVKLLTPKEVMFEGGREIVLAQDETPVPRYYVYGKYGVEGTLSDESAAVNLAYGISGVVVNDKGGYVWFRGNRSTKNQIMAIKGSTVTEEKNSLAVCLDVILQYEGIMRNTEQMLNNGETVRDILQENMEDVQVLDLSGCSLDAILYYVNIDIPVLASLSDGSAVLIVGFNELNTVIMDPMTGNVEKKGMNDSKQLFEENGNRFTTYVRNEK